MAEVEAATPQAGNCHNEKEKRAEIKTETLPTSGQKNDSKLDVVADAEEKKQETLGERVPISAHQRKRRDDNSSKVQEARRYNDRDRNSRGNGRSRGEKYSSPRKYANHNRFDPSSLAETDDPVAIRKQVEFYFSDSNLLTDKFLFTKMEGHQNVPVPVDVVHSFKRMKHFQPRSAVIAALKESTTLDLVNHDNDIKRKEPLPEGLVGKPMNEIQQVHESQSMARSIYAKGFGEEEASTQFDIEAFFANYGSTNSVRLRRSDNDRKFKGSVFVEFDSEETAKAFLTTDLPPEFKGKVLELKSKKQYCDDKVEDIKAGRVRPNSADRSRQGGFRGGRRDYDDRDEDRRRTERRDLDKHDDRDWRLRRDEDAKEGFPERQNADDRKDHERQRRGSHRGFGSSGRGRGGRGDRGNNRERELKAREERSSSAEAGSKDSAVSGDQDDIMQEKDAKTVNKPNSENAIEETQAIESPSKKRSHEDDKGEDQREKKKVDVKETDTY